MNTQIQLSEGQQDSRINKGYTAFLEGKVTKTNISRLYQVVGSKGELRMVEDLTMEGDINEFYTCTCPDHEYRKVVCYHQIAVQFYKLENGA